MKKVSIPGPRLSQVKETENSSDRGMKFHRGIDGVGDHETRTSMMRNNSESLCASQISFTDDSTVNCNMNSKKKEKFGLFRNLRRRIRSINKKSEENEKDFEEQIVHPKATSPGKRQKHSGKCRLNLCSKPSNSNSSQSTESLDMSLHLQRKLEDGYWSNKDWKDNSPKKEKASCRSKDISKFQTECFMKCTCDAGANSAVNMECKNCQKISNISPHSPSSHMSTRSPSSRVEITAVCHTNVTNPNSNPTVHYPDYTGKLSDSAINKDAPKTWSLTHELFRLSKFGWYWGPITRREAERKLNGQPDGAFLVRDSSDERYLLSLSFRSYGRTLHTRIEHCNGKFIFDAQPDTEGYPSIVDLIENSMNDPQTGICSYSRRGSPSPPIYPVRLTKPVSRFTQVRSLQYMCRFVIRQYTRYDHIQLLPLPRKLKGWIGENQY